MADEAQRFRDEWVAKHRRYFRIAGITVRIESEVDFDTISFKEALLPFAVDGPGDDTVTLRHQFELPDLAGKELGKELYRKPPWAISRTKNGTWFYRGISPDPADERLHRVAVFSPDHRHGRIYSPPRDLEQVRTHEWHSLSLFPTDQIWLAPLLADRNAVLLHSASAIVDGQGLVFVGHSSAGKSTTMEMLKAARAGFQDCEPVQAEILCDDRSILRKWPSRPQTADGTLPEGGWRVHGTWSHGTTADVSSASAPLAGILFLKQDSCNTLIPLTDRKAIWKRLLATLIRSAITAEWWHKELEVLHTIVDEVPCYTMYFDTSGAIVRELKSLITG